MHNIQYVDMIKIIKYLKVLQHVSDHRGSIIVECLAKNYKNDSIASADMHKVGVMAAYSGPMCVSVFHCI
jgi:hypothetical protein